MQKTTFLLLIIYNLFSLGLYSQNLTLKIVGNNESESNIAHTLNYIKTHTDYKSITLEVDSIRNALFKMGYIENNLEEISKTNDSLFTAKIHLKKKYNTIYIYYNKKDIDVSILNLVSNKIFDDYFTLSFSKIETALNYINSEISKKGYPFSKLKLSNIEIKNKKNLKANLIIDSKEQKRSISNIVLKGYEKFPKSYLKHYLKIKRSQVFNLNEINKKTKLLNDLKFAAQIKPPEVLFSKDSTTLYMYIKKSQSNTFDGFLGFGTNEETNKLEFDGYLNLNLINNLNFGESFRLLYKSDENDQKTFRTDLSLPYLFKSPIGLNLQLQIFKKDSSFTTVNQSVKLHYQLNSRHKIYSGISTIESNNLLNDTSSSNFKDYKTNYYTFAYEYFKPQLNNLLFPVNSKIYLETSFGNRKRSSNTEKQSQINFETFKIINFNNKNSIYLKVNISTLMSDTYIENELFRFGGINSIRGFEENSLLASLYSVLNTEYRYQLNRNIFVHSIIDAAYFENKIANQKEKLFGYGFGFGILTKSGLLKFNYANGKSQNQKFKFSNSKIHLSLIASF